MWMDGHNQGVFLSVIEWLVKMSCWRVSLSSERSTPNTTASKDHKSQNTWRHWSVSMDNRVTSLPVSPNFILMDFSSTNPIPTLYNIECSNYVNIVSPCEGFSSFDMHVRSGWWINTDLHVAVHKLTQVMKCVWAQKGHGLKRRHCTAG